MKRAFSLVEMMVGLLISLILVSLMAVFFGDVSYIFQDHKTTIRDRSQLQRNLLIMSRELMEVGYGTKEIDDQAAKVEVKDLYGNSNYEWFVDVQSNGSFPALSFWTSSENMDTLSSQDDTLDINWTQFTYQIQSVNHPVTQEAVPTLMKNGLPFIFGINQFTIELGVDLDDDGLVSEVEWTQDYPEDEAAKANVYPKLRKIRISTTTGTLQASKENANNEVIYNRMSQEIFLRNRRAA